MSDNDICWFLFDNGMLLLQMAKDDTLSLPKAPAPPFAVSGPWHELSTHDGMRCVAVSLDGPVSAEGWKMLRLREAADLIGDRMFHIAGKGVELLHWDAHSRYCGQCGGKTVQNSPISKHCPGCGMDIFPKISVAVLALITKDDSTLLVRARNFSGPFYGLVSGFLETGESLEECVRREVLEETALHIEDIRYFGSQPWPFPSSLMVGFTARYKSGTICLQEDELLEADFFRRDELPLLPSKLSLTRQMIDWWASNAPHPGER